MEFRTPIPAQPSDITIGHKDRVFTLGSCFADHIGQKMLMSKFDIMVNPFFPTYNPVSIFDQVEMCFSGKGPDKDLMLEREGLFFNLGLHTHFSAVSMGEHISLIDNVLLKARDYCRDVRYVLVTLGTAWYYRHKPSGKIVANCHKIPSGEFEKHIFSIRDIADRFYGMRKSVPENLHFIISISPVRHLRDGFKENSLSKSILRVAVEEIVQSDPKTYYFPAYETMMDDLRDYRFYKTDMLHPNDLAVDYIWGKFQGSWFSEETNSVIHRWGKVKKALGHRPMNPGHKKHLQFLHQTLEEIKGLSAVLDVGKELKDLEMQLKGYRNV